MQGMETTPQHCPSAGEKRKRPGPQPGAKLGAVVNASGDNCNGLSHER